MALSGVVLFKAGHRRISTKNSQIWRTQLFFFFLTATADRGQLVSFLPLGGWRYDSSSHWSLLCIFIQCTEPSACSGACSLDGERTEWLGTSERGRAFWVKSWLGKGPDCQVTCNDVRAQHNLKTPASQANKSLNNNRKITKLCCQSCSFRPLPFTWNGKNSRKRAYILKDSGCILFLPFGNKVLTSKETVLRMSPAAVPWGVFFEILFKAVLEVS